MWGYTMSDFYFYTIIDCELIFNNDTFSDGFMCFLSNI